MKETLHSAEDLQQIYRSRFAGKSAYRQKVWRVLSSYFSAWISPDDAVLDLGAGHCEFINSVECSLKYAMDLNPETRELADCDVTFIHQDCSQPWHIPPATLDVVFTSNFFEHLPSKMALERTLEEAHQALKPGGRLIAMGPNIKVLPGRYWDFFDHYLPLTELSLAEVAGKCGFMVSCCWPRFLPYTMSPSREYPLIMLHVYLQLPLAWRFFGQQFLVVLDKPL
jgi:SAM-dependent methyltransferase